MKEKNLDEDLLNSVARGWGDFSKAEVLLKEGANPNVQDSLGMSLLSKAINLQNKEMARLLLKYGANPNLQDYDGWTPLFWAAVREDMSTIAILAEYGADPTLKDVKGNTARTMANIPEREKVSFFLADYERAWLEAKMIGESTPSAHKKKKRKMI